MRVLDLKDKSYWRLLIAYGLPIAFQNLIFNSFSLVDNILVGGLGDANIAAVGVANKLVFIYAVFLFGINSGSNIFSAQFWGKKDIAGVRKVLGLSLIIGLGISVPFTLVGVFAPHLIVDIFSDDPLVIREGAIYLSIVAWTFPIGAVSSAYAIQSRGVGRPKVPLIASAIALTTNGFLDYIMIYGKLGLPAMGVRGAAIATLIAKMLECVIIIGITYGKKYELAAKLSDFKGYTSAFLRRYITPITPVIINELLWSTGVTVYTYFYGVLGTEAVATVQILDVINGIFISLFMGIGNATGAIIGNLIGAEEDDRARVYAKRTLLVGIGLGIFVSILLVLFAPLFLSFFNISASTQIICKITIRVYALYMIPRILNHIIIVGIFRGGGDTVFAAILDVCAPWLIGIPMAYLGVRIFEFPVYYVMAMIQVEELVKNVVGITRVLSGKWLHNLVRDIKPATEELAPSAEVL